MVESLLTDVAPESTMFRIVVKSNLDLSLAQNLVDKIEDIVPVLSRMEHGMNTISSQKEMETVKRQLSVVGGTIAETLQDDEGGSSTEQHDFNARSLFRKAGRMQIISYTLGKKSSVGRNSFAAC
jgi:hypothetical protein